MVIDKQIISVAMICGTALIITGIWRSTIYTIDSYQTCRIKIGAMFSRSPDSMERSYIRKYCNSYPWREEDKKELSDQEMRDLRKALEDF